MITQPNKKDNVLCKLILQMWITCKLAKKNFFPCYEFSLVEEPASFLSWPELGECICLSDSAGNKEVTQLHMGPAELTGVTLLKKEAGWYFLVPLKGI